MFLFWLRRLNIITIFTNTTQGQNILRKYVNPTYYVSREPCDNTNSGGRRQSVDYVWGLAIASVTNPQGFSLWSQSTSPGMMIRRSMSRHFTHSSRIRRDAYLFKGGWSQSTPMRAVLDQLIYRSSSSFQALLMFRKSSWQLSNFTSLTYCITSNIPIIQYHRHVYINLSHRPLGDWYYFGLSQETLIISFSKTKCVRNKSVY